MKFSDLLGSMRRQWLVVLSGLLVTVGLCIAAMNVAPPGYQAEASVLLLPAASDSAGGANPYLSLGGLKPTADAVARAMTDSGVQGRLEKAGAGGEYDIKTDPTTNGPVLLVTVTDRTPAETLNTLDLVLAEVPKVLTEMQARVPVPASALLGSSAIAQDQAAELMLKDRLRVLAAVAALGLAVTFGAVVFLDTRARQRATSRRRRTGSSGRKVVDDETIITTAMSVAQSQQQPSGHPAQPTHSVQSRLNDLEHAETVPPST
jgi:hypothetical protein